MPKPLTSPTLDTGNALGALVSHWWLCYEGSGATAHDIGASPVNGTLTNGATWGTTAAGDQCLSFPTIGPVTLGSTISLTGNWTLAWRAKQAAADFSGACFGSIDSTSNCVFVTGGFSGVRVYDHAGNLYAWTLAGTTAEHNYALVSDGSSLKLYVDGTLAASRSATAARLDFAWIGGGFGGGGYNLIGLIDYAVIFSAALDASQVSSLNSDPYQMAAGGVEPNTVTITNPVPYQARQRSTNGGVSNYPVSGVYTGTPATIRVRVDSGSWSTLDAAPGGGTFSGVVAVPDGTHSISVDFSNDNTTINTVVNVGVGDIFLIAGQSNSQGIGGNSQSYDDIPGTAEAGKFIVDEATWLRADGTFHPGVGPFLGAAWPHLASEYLATFPSRAIGLISSGIDGSSITGWSATYTGNRLDAVINVALQAGGAIAVLWWQGETDAENGMDQMTYQGHLATIGDRVWASLACPLVPCRLQNSSGIADGNEVPIRAATDAVVAAHPHVLPGPDFSDITSDDSYHLTSDLKLRVAGRRWWACRGVQQVLGLWVSGGGPVPLIGSPIIRSLQ